jgi:integrase
MASLFKTRITRYVDETGKRVTRDTPGAHGVKEKSRKWYGEYVDENGKTTRVPLAADKASARTMLNDIVRRVERKQAGLFDKYEEHEKKPLNRHIDDYDAFLRGKECTDKHVAQTIRRIRALVTGCEFSCLSEIDVIRVSSWLAEKRQTEKRFSAQTRNFYRDCFSSFCQWLSTYGRLQENPVRSLKRIKVETDRRHDRRALQSEEFERLIWAAETGWGVEGVRGPDRAMLYVLACWTGYRRGELASLTVNSIDLKSELPTVRVGAEYSKRRKKESIPLHPFVVTRLNLWLTDRGPLKRGEPLFELKTAKGHWRKTAKMMKRDLERARKSWIEEAESTSEKIRREESDFLRYQNEDGLFADFHANRHTFITNLAIAQVPLAMAQKLARHSDPRLTSNIYTHLENSEKAEAIGTLPAPAEREHISPPVADPDSLVAGMVAGNPAALSPELSQGDNRPPSEEPVYPKQKPLRAQGLDIESLHLSSTVKVHPTGFEPVTSGSVGQNSTESRSGNLRS